MLAVVAVGLYALYQNEPTETGDATVRVEDGAAVLEVDPRGDAAAAGLWTGERVVSLRGRPVTLARADSLDGEFLFFGNRGDSVVVRVEGAGRVREAVVVLGAQNALDARRLGLSQRWVDRVGGGVWFLGVVAFALCGLFLFARARARGYLASLGVALLSVAGAAAFVGFAEWDGGGWSRSLLIALMLVAVLAFFSAIPAVTSALVRFPDGTYTPRWTRHVRALAIAGFLAVLGLVVASQSYNVEWVEHVGLGMLVAVVALPVLGLVQKYRRAADAVVRQQMKWVLLPLGAFLVVLALTPPLAESVTALDSDRTAMGHWFNVATGLLAGLAFAAVPLGVVAGALNFRPWDADLWIGRSVSVGAATLGLAAVFAGAAEGLRVGMVASMGEGGQVAAAATAAVLSAVLFNPVRERVQAWVERDRARRRRALTQSVPRLLGGRQAVAAPGALAALALGRVREALDTEEGAVFALDGGALRPLALDRVNGGAAEAWAAALAPDWADVEGACQEWGREPFVLTLPLRTVEGDLVGALALGPHGRRGRGYSTDEQAALVVAAEALAEALVVAQAREAERVHDRAALAGVLRRLDDLAGRGDGAAPVPA